jgi:hypothetical protein
MSQNSWNQGFSYYFCLMIETTIFEELAMHTKGSLRVVCTAAGTGTVSYRTLWILINE